jgi:chitinase
MFSVSRFTTAALFVIGPIALGTLQPASAGVGDRAVRLPKRLVADYGYWSKYQKPSYGAAQIPFSMLTNVIHAGLTISQSADGTFSVPGGFVEPALIAGAHAAGVKVSVLLGGDAHSFSKVARDREARRRLVRNLAAFAARNGYDGADIDWEYPTPTDRHAFTELMRALRIAFPAPAHVVSADVAPWGGAGYDFDRVANAVDFFNVMMYDAAGPWTSDAQLNSPIFNDPRNPQPQGDVKDTIDLFLGFYHLAPEKLNMGTPFYGYYYTNVTGLWAPCNPCDGRTVRYENYGTYIKPLVNHAGWVEQDDPIALVPYLLRADGSSGFITYDDASSTYYRVRYSLWKRGLGGAFMWALDEDYDGRSQDLLSAMHNAIASDAPEPAPARTAGWVNEHGTVYRTSGYLPASGTAVPVRPDTRLAYHGGPVLEVPAVYVTFWGYKAAGDPKNVKADLEAFLSAVGGSAWENTITQYYGPSGHISNPPHQLMGVWEDDVHPIPRHPSDAQMAAEAAAGVAVFGYNANAVYIVASAHNHAPKGFGTTYCGYHGETVTGAGTIAYLPLGYMPDVGANCGAGVIPPSPDQPSADEGVSIVGGAEYADTITEPQGGTGWNSGGTEIAGLCGAFTQIQNVRFGKKSFALGALWSNAQNGCLF